MGLAFCFVGKIGGVDFEILYAQPTLMWSTRSLRQILDTDLCHSESYISTSQASAFSSFCFTFVVFIYLFIHRGISQFDGSSFRRVCKSTV